MEKLTKENFMEYIRNTYRPYQEQNEKNFSEINRFQRNMNFKEFYDITIRCNNALVNAVHYFNDKGINYYGNSIDNQERVLMLACESYIYKLFADSQNEYNQYVNSANKISGEITSKLKFKIQEKYGKQIMKLTKKPIDFSKYYNDIQYHVDNFHNIGEEIIEFNPDKDILKAIEWYLPILFNNLEAQTSKISMSVEKQKDLKYKIFHSYIKTIINFLMKVKKFDDVQTVCDLELNIINDDFNKYKESIKTLKKEK